MDIIAEIRDDHEEWNGYEEAICCHCEGSWPCSAERAAREIERLRAEFVQVRAFAKVMDENNWRDLSLRIQRQGIDKQLTEKGK
jgi:hypothetical protein